MSLALEGVVETDRVAASDEVLVKEEMWLDISRSLFAIERIYDANEVAVTIS